MTSFEKEFWSKTQQLADSDCWEWRGKKRAGYGRVHVGRWLGAHRVAYELAGGVIPEGMCILHKCDNPSCVNPDHLMVGTHTDNMRDAASKGRLRLQKDPTQTQGERHPMAKLSAVKVRAIRAAKGSASTYSIARDFGVSQATVHQIHVGRTWKSLT